MTAAYEQPLASTPAYAGPQEMVAGNVVRAVPASLALGGLALAGVSAWGGIAPYVGPGFGYSPDDTPSFTWNLAHSLLALAPGVVGLLCGLLVLASAGRAAVGRGRSVIGLAGLGALASGAWFAFGPSTWPVLWGASYPRATGSYRALELAGGLSVGPGVIIASLGGLALGWALRQQRMTALAPTTRLTSVAAPVSPPAAEGAPIL